MTMDTERPAFGASARRLEARREQDDRLLAMDAVEREKAFTHALDDAIEEDEFPVRLGREEILALIDIVDDHGGPLFDGVAEKLGRTLAYLIAKREAAWDTRREKRAERDAALAVGDKHPFYVDHRGLYVGALAAAGVAAVPYIDDPSTYAGAYAEYVAGGRKSKPSPGSQGFKGSREDAAILRRAIEAERDALVTEVRVLPGTVLKQFTRTRAVRGAEDTWDVLTVDQIVALLDVGEIPGAREQVVAALEADAVKPPPPEGRRYYYETRARKVEGYRDVWTLVPDRPE